MLNIGLNIKLDIDKVQYPVYFEKHNICIHCGAEGQLIFVDKFGRETKNEIHPFDHIKCKSCNRLYSILWQRDESNNKMFPTAVDPSLKQEFVNLLTTKVIQGKGEKTL